MSKTYVLEIGYDRPMGNREDLLAGAKRCLVEKGYARTTARDIAAAAGTSLAAIGYHFGSKEELLTQALLDATGAGVGDALEVAMRASVSDDPAQEFTDTWNQVRSVFADQRPTLAASLENLAQVDRLPAVRKAMGEATVQAVGEIRDVYRELHPGVADERAQAVAELYFTLLNGLGILWLTDEDSPPTGESLAMAIGTLSGAS